MFSSQNVPCILSNFSGHGDDAENKEVKLVFHVAPITHELAMEVSPRLADRLFRHNTIAIDVPEWEPAREMPKASFSTIQIQMQNITFRGLPDEKKGAMVPSAAISNLRAARAFPESTDFRLEFDVVVPMDDVAMELIRKFYKSTCFLSMEQVQREIEIKLEDEKQAETHDLLQGAADEPAVEDKPKKRGRKPRETVEA